MRYYIAAIVILLMVVGIIYGTMQYKDNQNQKNEAAYRNEINTLKSEKNKLEKVEKETKAKKDFFQEKVEIEEKSAAAKTYTEKMMGDKNVKTFDDSF